MNEEVFVQYPNLTRETTRGNMFVRLRNYDAQLANQFASNAWIIPLIANDQGIVDQCIIVRKQDGHIWIPGGTCEPDEHWIDTAHREILEEAGAKILNMEPFCMFDCVRNASSALRPHLPHPRSIRVVMWAQVEIVQMPSDPVELDDGVKAQVLPLHTAIAFLSQEDPELADLYRLGYAKYMEAI